MIDERESMGENTPLKPKINDEKSHPGSELMAYYSDSIPPKSIEKDSTLSKQVPTVNKKFFLKKNLDWKKHKKFKFEKN